MRHSVCTCQVWGSAVTITLPFPPSANRYWRHARGRTYLAKEALAYRDTVRLCCLEQGVALLMIAKALIVTIELSPPNHRKWDIDNRIKQLLDALAYAGVYCEDEQIVKLTALKLSPVPGGRCVVAIEENEKPLTGAIECGTI